MRKPTERVAVRPNEVNTPPRKRRGVRLVVGGLALLGLTALAFVAAGRYRASLGRTDEQPSREGPTSAATRLETSPADPRPEGMVWIPAGTYRRGMEDGPDTLPVREIEVDGFWIDRTEVTNAQFAAFVKATGYVTVAERAPDPKLYPGVPAEALVPGSIVFTPPAGEVNLNQPLSWWRYVPGADWRHPEGPSSSIAGRDDHPVVQVCWDDAVAYARWAGKRLPTESEWEYAARGGLESRRYTWGDERKPGGRWQANIWQGRFPVRNLHEDGYAATAPVATFPPNGYGLHDMAGNVWEWCADWYRPDAYARGSAKAPTGPESSDDPEEPGVPKRVQRGGSFLCSDQYCVRYLPGARGKGAPDSAANHTGFRCVRSGPEPSLPVNSGRARTVSLREEDESATVKACCTPPNRASLASSIAVRTTVGNGSEESR